MKYGTGGNNVLIAIIVPLIAGACVFLALLIRAAVIRKAAPSAEGIALGAITNFFDTLGIGSFAPTMAWIKFRKLVPDGVIPQTMFVGHSFPAMIQALIFLVLFGVLVDPVLLAGCIFATMAGAMLGVAAVSRAQVWMVQTVVGIGLLLAACFYVISNLELMPIGGTAASLPPFQTIVAIVTCFVFGILINFGIGNFAPTLALLSLMGMDPRLCFPIMAGGSALAAASAGVRHVQIGVADFRLATGIALGGVPAVLVAAFLVKEMPVETLRWLVAAVVLYAGVVMLRTGLGGRSAMAAL